ncbi:MAG: hypothetical protein AB7I30_21105 [Isosphaeraceae bacterium]
MRIDKCDGGRRPRGAASLEMVIATSLFIPVAIITFLMGCQAYGNLHALIGTALACPIF